MRTLCESFWMSGLPFSTQTGRDPKRWQLNVNSFGCLRPIAAERMQHLDERKAAVQGLAGDPEAHLRLNLKCRGRSRRCLRGAQHRSLCSGSLSVRMSRRETMHM